MQAWTKTDQSYGAVPERRELTRSRSRRGRGAAGGVELRLQRQHAQPQHWLQKTLLFTQQGRASEGIQYILSRSKTILCQVEAKSSLTSTGLTTRSAAASDASAAGADTPPGTCSLDDVQPMLLLRLARVLTEVGVGGLYFFQKSRGPPAEVWEYIRAASVIRSSFSFHEFRIRSNSKKHPPARG